jgi:hypothetical protein
MPACALSASSTAEALCALMHVSMKHTCCKLTRCESVSASVLVPCSSNLLHLEACMKRKQCITLEHNVTTASASTGKSVPEKELAQACEGFEAGQ